MTNKVPNPLVKSDIREGIQVVLPEGRLDHEAAPEFENQLMGQAELAIQSQRPLVIDLANVSFVSSIILKIIRKEKLRLDEHGLKVGLCSPTAVVKEILEIAKFHYVAPMHNCFEDAASAAKPQS